MKIAGIEYYSDCNGSGFRNVLFISGCWHSCRKYCHNKQVQDPNFGEEKTIDEVIELLNKKNNKNITISGGDGLTYQVKNTIELVKTLKEKYNKNIWLYTGYKFEELLKDNIRKEVLKYVDVIVDNNFNPILAKENPHPLFRGDIGQKIIDVQKSLKQNKIIEWDDNIR